MTWEQDTIEYWTFWKPCIGVPGVVAWWWTGGAVGLSPWQYLDHAFDVYDRGRRDYLARNPGASAYPGSRYEVRQMEDDEDE